MQLDCGKQTLNLEQPKIMGVLNATPDSFSDGGSYYTANRLDVDLVLARARQMVAEGASIIDIGGESTRPGASPVSAQQELERVIPLVEAIASDVDVVISVDTSTPEVMLEAAKAGAGMLNDVRALSRDGALEAALKTDLPVCLMHMQGQPQGMQHNPQYGRVVNEVLGFLSERVAACESAGIAKQKLLLDPGFGFGKSLEHNLLLLKHLGAFEALGLPLLVGLSRKSMFEHLLGRPVDQRLPASVSAALMAVQQGASIVRVHDVAATADSLTLWAAVKAAV